MKDLKHVNRYGAAVPFQSVDFNIAGTCEEMNRTLRLIKAAVEVYHGFVLSRRFDPDGAAEIELQFKRGLCVEMYALLVSIGLQLNRDSHIRFTSYCQCTREQFRDVADSLTSIAIRLREPEREPLSRRGCAIHTAHNQ